MGDRHPVEIRQMRGRRQQLLEPPRQTSRDDLARSRLGGTVFGALGDPATTPVARFVPNDLSRYTDSRLDTTATVSS